MALTIVNNVASLNAQTNLNRASSNLSKSLERLSSGLKINRGADGPAALVVSEQQRAQISGLQTAIGNTSQAVNLVQTGEGALNEINSLLVQVRALALDSANSNVQDSNSLAANQAEISNALGTIDNIATTTEFNTQKLFDGSAGLSGSADDSDIKFLKADSGTAAGVYRINVTTAAQKGTVSASQAQTDGLAQEEALTINGVSISLEKGLSQTELVSDINKVKDQTVVSA